MFSPKKVRYRKRHKCAQELHKKATRGNFVAFGEYGLMAMSSAWIDARQIEAARRAMTRHIKRGGQVWIRIFPHLPYTKKPAEVRMGSGKGSLDKWVAVVTPGTVLFELGSVDIELARRAIELAGNKLPVKTKFVTKNIV